MSLTRILTVLVFLILYTAMTPEIFPTTLISPAPANELSLTPGDGVVDQLYGNHNLTRIDDRYDQVWIIDGGQATVSVRARFAGFSFAFGYRDQFGLHTLFEPSGNNFALSGYARLSTPFLLSWTLSPSGAPEWSSLMSENIDLQDHMVTFLITGGARAGGYLLAWEDLPFLGDKDYNDLVVEVQGVRPGAVPEPTPIVLLSLGLVCLAFGWQLKRRKRS